MIDDWLEDVPLVRLIEKAIDSDDETEASQATEDALSSASRERAERLLALQKKTSLSSRLDLRSARDLRDASDERRLQPLFIQRFFERAWTACGGTIRKDDHFPVWHIGATPTSLLNCARNLRQPLSENHQTPFVFDKQLVSVASRVHIPERTKLLGPGHPLFDTLIEWTISEARQTFARGAILVDPNIARPQRVWLVRSTIDDGRRQWRREGRKPSAHERLAVIVQDHLGLRTTSPSYLLNCAAPEPVIPMPEITPRDAEEIQAWAYEHVTESQLDQLRIARTEECELRRQYLNTAFTDLILELQHELNDLQQAHLFGDENVEDRDRLRSRIEELGMRKKERLNELELMLNLSANLPDLLTEALIAPVPVATIEAEGDSLSRGFPMHRDDEAEAIAMDVAMRYERSRGWTPTDVSDDGEHYDIRSEGHDGEKRFIEVKGRAQSGGIIVTGPERDRLQQLGERAWLYVVTYCKGEKSRLRIIQNPFSKLTPEMLYRQVQYFVEENDWTRQGREVETTGLARETDG